MSDTSDTSQPAHGDSESRTGSSFVLVKRPTERITVVRYGGHSLGVEISSISCDGSGAVRVKAKATEPKVKKSGMTGRSRNGGDDVQELLAPTEGRPLLDQDLGYVISFRNRDREVLYTQVVNVSATEVALISISGRRLCILRRCVWVLRCSRTDMIFGGRLHMLRA